MSFIPKEFCISPLSDVVIFCCPVNVLNIYEIHILVVIINQTLVAIMMNTICSCNMSNILSASAEKYIAVEIFWCVIVIIHFIGL